MTGMSKIFVQQYQKYSRLAEPPARDGAELIMIASRTIPRSAATVRTLHSMTAVAAALSRN